MECFLGRSAVWWLEVSHVLFAEGIGGTSELKDRLVKRKPDDIQLTADEAGYYFGMDPERSQWWFDAAAYAKGRHPWHFSAADR